MSRSLSSTQLKRLHREWRRRTEGRVALVLDGVGNPFNVGAILRSAAAFSVDRLWLAGHVPDPGDAKVAKTALGSQRFLQIDAVETIADALTAATADGYRTVGIELAEESLPLHELDLATSDVCLVLGHEDRGLSKDALAACDALGYVPQLGRIGSLNVATATAVALYEVRRQVWTT